MHAILIKTLSGLRRRSSPERERLLSVIVVGGGPTGVEFAGELCDFINKDLRRLDPERAAEMK